MRGLTSTLILLVVLAGLVGYIYVVDRGDSGGDETTERAFASVSADAIEEVQITSADGETSRARKTDEGWQLVEPVETPADEDEISSITSSLASLDIQRTVDEAPTDLAQYGLDPARIEVTFRVAGETEPKRILFGERTPTGGDLYARLPDETRVVLVSSFLDSTFNKSAFALRRKNVVEIERADIDGVELVAGQRSVTMAKRGAEWRIVEPIAARADFGAVEGALERLASARMQSIVAPEADDLTPYALDPPIAAFTALSGSSRATLLLGETSDALLYAKDASRPMVFTVAPTLYTDLIRDVSEYRRKDLFDARSFTATRAEIRRDGETIVLEKTAGTEGTAVWRNAAGEDVDTAAVEGLLTTLSSLRAESFDATAHAALKTPALTVVMRFDDDRTEEVTFARAGDEVVASRADEPGSARVEAARFDEAVTALDTVL
jgi:hypothetical protein